VALAAVALRRPLARVPENMLKLAVGVLIGSFGTFWMGEGLGFHWPGGDLAILGLAAGFLIVSLLVTVAVRRQTGRHDIGRRRATSQGSTLPPSLDDCGPSTVTCNRECSELIESAYRHDALEEARTGIVSDVDR
jgi:hypothetical protein